MVARPGTVGIEEVAPPTPGPDEIVVRPLAGGLCGTDLELIDGTVDAAFVRYPLVLGHEWVGRLDGDASGDGLVVVEGVIPDGTCEACRRGATNLCVHYDEMGFTRPGALADAITVPARLVHRLDGSVPAIDAALVEPMSVVWRAISRVARVEGARCLVVGDGTVALLSAYLLRRRDPARVDVLGARPAQAGLAASAGADRFVTDAPGERYDVVVEAAGQVAAVERAIASAARGATVVLLGLPPHGSRVTFAPDGLVNDDLTIQGSFSYTRESWSQVVDMLNRGQVRPSWLVTHRVPFAQWERAIETLRAVPADRARGKILVTLDDSLS